MSTSVSVVIPVKQDPEGLTLTLDSLPTDMGLEIIIVDAGQCSRILDIVNERSESVDQHLVGLDTGIAHAMNLGIKHANKVYVAILNAGDSWFPWTLPNFINASASTNPDEIYHGTIEYRSDDGATYCVSPDIEKMHRRMFIFHPTMFVKRSLYKQIGGYDQSYILAMDSEWCHRAIVSGAKFSEIIDRQGRPAARMALGGRSDVNANQALLEFRRSLIQHNIASPATSYLYYWVTRVGKRIASFPFMRRLLSRYLARS